MAVPGTKPMMSDEQKAKLIKGSADGTELNANLAKIGGLSYDCRFYPSKELVAMVTAVAWLKGFWSGTINDPDGRVDEDMEVDFKIPEAFYHDPEFDRHFVIEDEIVRAAFFPTNVIPPALGLREKVVELLGLVGTVGEQLRLPSPIV